MLHRGLQRYNRHTRYATFAGLVCMPLTGPCDQVLSDDQVSLPPIPHPFRISTHTRQVGAGLVRQPQGVPRHGA